METCLFLIVILKETLVLTCLASHFDIIESWKLNVGHRDIYYAKKILNSFVCVEVRIIVEKLNVYEGHIFPSPFLKTCRLETTSLYLNTRLFVNKNFQILKIFIEINLNFCLLCAHHVIKSLILHTRDLTVNKKSVTHFVSCFSWFYFFAFWVAEKHVFHIVQFCHEVCTKEYQGLGGQ